MVDVISMCASSAVPLKVAQTVEKHFALTVPENVTAGMILAVKVALQGIVNVNMMGARGYTVMTVLKTKNTIWNVVKNVMKHIALSVDT